MRSLQLRLGGLDLRLRPSAAPSRPGRNCARVVQPCSSSVSWRSKRLRASVNARLRGGEICLRRAQRVHLVLRLEPRDELPGFDPVSNVDRSFDHPAGNAKAERRLVLGLDAAGEARAAAGFALLDRDGANGARLRAPRLSGANSHTVSAASRAVTATLSAGCEAKNSRTKRTVCLAHTLSSTA